MSSALEPNPWCARVWRAMAAGCSLGEQKCRQDFKITCTDGWPMEGRCSCGRTWQVHENKLTKGEGHGNCE